MKRFLSLIFSLFIVMSCLTVASAEDTVHVIASFYPFYLFAKSVFMDMDHFEVSCMTAPQTGCLHDYQLLTTDLMKLEGADLFIICGAGMESFMDRVFSLYPELPVIDCSVDLKLIYDSEHPDEANAHTWLDAHNAIRIVRTICRAACERYPDQAEQLILNTENYEQRLTALDEEIAHMLAPFSGRKIITFHEAFPYYAAAYQLDVAGVINQEPDQPLSPFLLAQVIRTVRENDCPPLFVETQYAQDAAYTVARETGASVWSLDPVVTGMGDPEQYIKSMLENTRIIVQALEESGKNK